MSNHELTFNNDLQMLLETQLPEIHDTISKLRSVQFIKGDDSNIEDLCDVLEWITTQMNRILEIFPQIIDSTGIEVSSLLEYLDWLQERKELLFELVNDINSIGPFLSDILEGIEANLNTDPYKSLDEHEMHLIDLIERCSTLRDDVDPWLNKLRKLLDATLEFKEISNDHMDGLDKVVSENIQSCFDIQEERFTSPVRHAPSFTLEQIVELLKQNSDSNAISVPTFNKQEKLISERFLELRRSVPAIEKSLADILPNRIDNFARRDMTNIDSLAEFLRDKYKVLMKKYEFMSYEISELNAELIDKRWNILFVNLNHEINFILDDYEKLKKKLNSVEEIGINVQIREKMSHQMTQKSLTIERTFKVIFKAQEFSLLDAGIASKTNEMKNRWEKVRVDDKLLRSVSVDSGPEISSVTKDFESLTLKNGSSHGASNRRSVSEGTPSASRQFGSVLLKRMRIKPVPNTNKDQLLDDPNPFFDKKSRNSGKLVLNSIPALPHNKDPVTEPTKISKPQTISSSTPVKTAKSLEELEGERIMYYKTHGTTKLPSLMKKAERTQFSKYKETGTIATPQRTPKSMNAWGPSSKRGNVLRPPTPLSALITPTSSRRRPF